jgi:hypothetical protein
MAQQPVHFGERDVKMFPFGKDVLMLGEVSAQMQHKILNFFCLGKLLVVGVDPGTCCSTSGKGDMGGFRAIGFQSSFGKPMLNNMEFGL